MESSTLLREEKRPTLRAIALVVALPLACAIALAVVVAAYINYHKYAALLADAEDARFGLVAQGVKTGIEANLNLGLQLADLSVARELLDRERKLVADTLAVAVFGANGTLLFSSGQGAALTEIPAATVQEARWAIAAPHWRATGVSLANSYGVTVGSVAVLFPREPRDAALASMHGKLTAMALWIAFCAAAIVVAGSRWLLRRPPWSVWSLHLLAAATLCLALLALAQTARTGMTENLVPELEKTTRAVALSLQDRLIKALDLGIPFDAIEGAQEYFDEALENNPDLAFVALADREGALLHAAGWQDERIAGALGKLRPRLGQAESDVRWGDLPMDGSAGAGQIVASPLMRDGEPIGALYVGVQGGRLTEQIADAQKDIFALLIAAMLLASEILRGALARLAGTAPAPAAAVGGPASSLLPIRLVILLFMFGEQLSRPFMPAFAGKLLPAGASDAAAAILAGLPIAVFMLTVALALPFLTVRTQRFGPRRSFLGGALVAVAGLVGASVCDGFAELLFWRAVAAFGYAWMYLACQNFVLANSPGSARAEGLALFIGAIMVAEFCAPAIGGMLADTLGERPVFVIGAGFMLLSAALGLLVLRGRKSAAEAPAAEAPGVGMRLARNLRFAVLVLTAAIPAKFALTALLFYIVPVSLASFGADYGEIGRIAMLYALPSLLLFALLGRLTQRIEAAGMWVALGGIVAGAGFVPLVFWPGPTAVAFGTLALGVGQALSISSQLTLLAQICEKEIAQYGASKVFGIFRFAERLGAALGPLVAGILTAFFGPVEAASLIGVFAFASAVAFAALFLILGPRRETDYFPAASPGRAEST